MNVVQRRMTVLGLVLAVIFSMFSLNPAYADAEPEAIDQVADAVEAVGEQPAAINAAVELPQSADDAAVLTGQGGLIELGYPEGNHVVAATDTSVVFEGAARNTHVVVESTGVGMRAAVTIDSERAPERFEFPLSGDVAQLNPLDDGSIEMLDDAGEVTGYVNPAWAVDAQGKNVPTHFEIDGTTLIQVVEHRDGRFEYGITADPSIWKIVNCGAAISVAIGSTVFAAAKILKIKKLVKAAGGVTKTAKRLIKAFSKKGSLSAKAKAGFGDLGKSVVALAVVVLDIDTIKNNCG